MIYSFFPKELIETDRLKLSFAKAAAELSAVAGGRDRVPDAAQQGAAKLPKIMEIAWPPTAKRRIDLCLRTWSGLGVTGVLTGVSKLPNLICSGRYTVFRPTSDIFFTPPNNI